MEKNMKINSITTHTGYLNSKASERMLGKERECVQNLKQMNNDQINTTIESNSDGRVSFKGSKPPLLHTIANFASDNPMVAEAGFAILITCLMRPLTIMATAKTDEEKEKCTYQAAKSVSTGVVGLVMSMVVGAATSAAAKLAQKKGAFQMPESMKKEAQKTVTEGANKLLEAAKNIANSGNNKELAKKIQEDLVSPVKVSEQFAKLIKEQPDKYQQPLRINLDKLKDLGFKSERKFKKQISEVAPEISEAVKEAIKQQKTIDNFDKTSKNVIDKMFQPIFMPIRATVTIALVPIILNALGLKKTPSKPKEADVKQAQQASQPVKPAKQSAVTNFGTNYNLFQTNNEKALFQSFSGVVNNENK